MKKKFSIFAFAVVASLASCSNDDSVESNSNFPADGVIRVTAGVDDPTSRAGQDEQNLEKFNFYVSCPTDGNYSYSAYMKKETGVWNSYSAGNGVTPLVMKWKDDQTSITVTALGIYKKTVPALDFLRKAEYSVLKEQLNEDSVMISDILYMNKKTINPQKGLTRQGAIPVELSHLLSKINITLNLAPEFNGIVSKAGDIKNVSVNGLKTIFLWNAGKDDTFSFELDDNRVNPTYIIARNVDFTQSPNFKATYECIAVPQAVAGGVFYISFVIDRQVYTVDFKAPLVTFLRGEQYSITVDVKKPLATIREFTHSPRPTLVGTVDSEYVVK